MEQNYAIDALETKREIVKAEMNKVMQEFEKQLSDIDSAIKMIRGDHVWDYSIGKVYDDSDPNYIKGSIED